MPASLTTEKIKELHKNDKEQLDVIFSRSKRLIVEAPAGYGKTKTMISKIAYLISTYEIPHPKKILALTFSVNAAYKIKKDVAESLPCLFENEKTSPVRISNKVFTTNYHGFCRRILRLYGYLLNDELKRIDLLTAVDDSNVENLLKLDIGLNRIEALKLTDMNDAVKKIDTNVLKNNYSYYLETVSQYFLKSGYITFNSILLFTIELFKKHPQVLSFYRNFFPIIIVDEFQDTNILSWSLLSKFIDEKDTKNVIFMGDSLQRIYGFIGAIPGLLEVAQKKFNMEKVELKTNHRFSNCSLLLQLDKNLRANATNPRNPRIDKNAELTLYESANQESESLIVLKTIKGLLAREDKSKIAILVKQRGRNIDIILDVLSKETNYFYALYSEEDEEYLQFHKICLKYFLEILISSHGRLTKNTCEKVIKRLNSEFKGGTSEINKSLLMLSETFFTRIFIEYNFLSQEEKEEFIKDTLENNALKQYLGYIESRIVVSTVHGAKGLEWEYVVLPDMEMFSFPNFPALCGTCQQRASCILDWTKIVVNSEFERRFYDELSVFYVAATRAKKEIRFSYSKSRITAAGAEQNTNLSCFLSLPGIGMEVSSFN